MKGTFLALIACMFFALDPVLSKKLLQEMSPLALAAVRASLAGTLLVLGMRVFHKVRELTEVSKHDLLMLLLVGLFGGTLAPLLVLYGLKSTSVTNTALLSRANPLLIALMAVVFLKEKISSRQIVGVASMLFGILFVVSRGFTLGFTPYPGDVYILSAAALWATSNILMKKHLQNIPPEVIVAFRNMVGGIILLSFAFGDVTTVNYTTEVITNLLILAIVTVTLSQLLWYKALEMTAASNVGLTLLTVPLFATAYAVILLGEKIAAYQIIGGLLIILGMLLLELHTCKVWAHELEHRLKAHHLFHH